MAMQTLESILSGEMEDEIKVKKIQTLIAEIRGDVTADSDGDGLNDDKDPFPYIASSPRVSWEVDSIALSWNVTRKKTETKESSKRTATTNANKTEKSFHWSTKAGGALQSEARTKAELNSNPLKAFGLFDNSIKGNVSQGASLEGQVGWSSNNKKIASNCYDALYSYNLKKEVTIDKLHLSCSVVIYNQSDEDYSFKLISIPVMIGNNHVVNATPEDGHPLGSVMTIPKGRTAGTRLLYKANLNTTNALTVVEYMKLHGAPKIKIEASGAKISSIRTGSDAISYFNTMDQKTLPVTVSAYGRSTTFRLAKNIKGKKLTLKDTMLALNLWTKSKSGKALFTFSENGEVFMGGQSLNNSSAWVVETPKKSALIDGRHLPNPLIISDYVNFTYVDRKALQSQISNLNVTKFGVTNLSSIDQVTRIASMLKKWPESRVLEGLTRIDDPTKEDDWKGFVDTLSTLDQQKVYTASLILGQLYLKGVFVEKDVNKAYSLFSKIDSEGFVGGQDFLSLCYMKGLGVAQNKQKTFDYAKSSSEQGNKHGQFLLGFCYLNGIGVDEDNTTALNWFKKSAAREDSDAQYWLGICYAYGIGEAKDLTAAINWLRKSADQGHSAAQYSLGWSYLEGLGAEQDFAAALAWFRKSADQENADGQYGLGRCYDEGLGVAQDRIAATEYFKKSATQGHGDAQYSLGLSYLNGIGVDEDIKTGIKWLEKSADQGNSNGQYLLGYCYREGVGVDKNIKIAVNLFTKSAEQGNSDGQCALGKCFRNGQGVAKNFNWAREYFSLSAEQGNSQGQYEFGRCYLYGHGVTTNYEKAAAWFKRSADLGDIDGNFELAKCYLYGQGVEKSENTAYELFKLSAQAGHKKAQEVLDAINER